MFANFVLTDEINRAPAKVQSALPRVMAERQVSLGGVTYPLPQPFLVLATQNPIESEGVYPLPEAQRDRFLMRIPVDYPTAHEEHEIVNRAAWPRWSRNAAVHQRRAGAAGCGGRGRRGPRRAGLCRSAGPRHPRPVGPRVEIGGLLAYGASPRASIGLIHAGRALALLRGRGHLLPQDVYDVAYDVLNHRLVLSFGAVADDVSVDDVLVKLLTEIVARGCRHRSSPPALRPGARPGRNRHERHRPPARRATRRDGALPRTTRITSPASAPIESLQLAAVRRLDGLLAGDHAGLFPGHGTERGEARPVPGDDPRHIDWAVTARTNDPHVRDTIADHELELWLVLDTSSSHAFGTGRSTKHELAWTAAGAFALLASRGGNRIGAVASGKGGRLIPARAGRAHTAAALTALRTPADGDADLAKAIRLVRKTAKRRGMVIVVSDFLGEPAWERSLRAPHGTARGDRRAGERPSRGSNCPPSA